MEAYEQSIRDNIAAIRARMRAAAETAGRDSSEIQLCAATKMNDADKVKAAIRGGVDLCGENRVQELQQKMPEGAYEGAPIHFIGHLQTNKVKNIVGHVDVIQSVDRLPLLEAVNAQAEKIGVCQKILLEVNIGNEESKSGFTVDELWKIVPKMGEYPGVKVAGLMAIPPISVEKGDNLIFFRQMHQLFIDIQQKKYDNVSMVCLSMGMSDDFEDAIACGSTMIRVGTAIFGARDYTKK